MGDQVIVVDVVVVGGGGAGLAAAARAAQLGCAVVLLEKGRALGGSTAWSVGSISATNTPHQRKHGIVDSPDNHFEDLGLFAGSMANRDNLALRRVLVDHTTEMFDWLLSTGLSFVGPNVEPPHRVARMHNIVPNSRAFPVVLGRHCRRLGVDIRLAVAAQKLLREGTSVCGVEARNPDGSLVTFRGRRGVVLASGDFSANTEMKARYVNDLIAQTPPVNSLSMGDGQRMGLDVGGQLVNPDIVHGPRMRFQPPSRPGLVQRLPATRSMGWFAKTATERLPLAVLRPFLMSFVTTALGVELSMFKDGAILINVDGERFVDELDAPALALPMQRDAMAYVLLDGPLIAKYTAWPYFISTAPGVAYAYIGDYRRNRADVFHQADTLDALAGKLSVPAEALVNAAAQSRDGGRASFNDGPFVALGPIRPYVVFSDGGLAVSEQLEVLDQDGVPIPGLYAAGSTGQGGVLLYGHGHHLAWAFVSGRIAGASAAAREPLN